jgi:hypothetical protein
MFSPFTVEYNENSSNVHAATGFKGIRDDKEPEDCLVIWGCY